MRRKRSSDLKGNFAAQTNSAVQALREKVGFASLIQPKPSQDVCYALCMSMQRALYSQVLAVASTHENLNLCLFKCVGIAVQCFISWDGSNPRGCGHLAWRIRGTEE